MTEMPGNAKHVGPYALIRELGRGGVGVVHEAHDPSGRTVALKLLLETSEVALKRFEREAHALGALSHPNIVRVHACGQSSQGPYLVTELVSGEGLDRACAREPLPAERAADIARQLADAVARAHAAGVLHRDLKPQNVILRPDGVPVLLDFGLARHESAETLTRSGALLGTPAYMAPEQAGDAGGGLDERADVYGLGAVLFHLLHGRPPFSASGPMQLVKKVLMDEPEWPSPATAPPALEAVCRKALAKDREARYASASGLRDDLARFLRGEPTLALPRARRSMALPALLGLGALSIAAGALVLRGRSAPPAPQVNAPAPGPRPPAPRAPRQVAEEALRDAEARTDSLAVAEAAARLLDLAPDHVAAQRALVAARSRPCWTAGLTVEQDVRLLPAGLGARGARLLLTTGEGAAQLWDLTSGGPAPTRRQLPGPVGAAAVDSARGCAWVGAAGQVLALALPSLEPQGAPIPLPPELQGSRARAVALSPDGARLALGCRTSAGGALALVDLATRTPTIVERYDCEPRAVTYERGGALWVVAGDRGEDEYSVRQAIHLFVRGELAPRRDVVSGVPTFVVEGQDGVVTIGTFTSELWLIDRGRDVALTLRKAFTEKTRREDGANEELPTFHDAACFDRRWLVIASARPERGSPDQNTVTVYDLEGAEARMKGATRLDPAWTVVVPGEDPKAIDVSDDGRVLVVAGNRGQLLAYPFFPR